MIGPPDFYHKVLFRWMLFRNSLNNHILQKPHLNECFLPYSQINTFADNNLSNVVLFIYQHFSIPFCSKNALQYDNEHLAGIPVYMWNGIWRLIIQVCQLDQTSELMLIKEMLLLFSICPKRHWKLVCCRRRRDASYLSTVRSNQCINIRRLTFWWSIWIKRSNY